MAGETIRNKAEELKGAAKEKLGNATDNKFLQAEGASEQAVAKAKQMRVDVDKKVEDINRP